MFKYAGLVIAGLAALGASSAMAQVSAATDTIPKIALSSTEAPTLEPMPANDLDAVRAGDDTHVDVVSSQTFSEQHVNAQSIGNSVVANTVTNGEINFSGNALNGYSGIGNFVLNTGNNNILQGSVSVTIGSTPGLP